MEKDTGAVVLAVVLAAAVLLLAVLKLAEFLEWYCGEKRYILTEISRAGNKSEYLYWRRELHYHYLCLIPFVTKRNAAKVYGFLFRRSKHAREKQTDVIMHILAPSVIGIAVCAVCLCTASWAWFTASTSAGTAAIKTPERYELSVSVTDGDNNPVLANDGNSCEYTLSTGRYTVTLSADGTVGASGYCKVASGGTVYYTKQVVAGGTPFSFTVNVSTEAIVTVTPKWGSRVRKADDMEIAENGEVAFSGTSTDAFAAHTPSAEAPAVNSASEKSVPYYASEKENGNKTETQFEDIAGE